MRPIDQTHLVNKHRGKWVALLSDRRTVIASGTTLQAVLHAARKNGCTHPIITRIPVAPAHFFGSLSPSDTSLP